MKREIGGDGERKRETERENGIEREGKKERGKKERGREIVGLVQCL